MPVARKPTKSEMVSPLPRGRQQRARAKVGSTSLTRLAWLLALLNRQPEQLALSPEKDRADLVAEVVAFSEPVGSVAGGASAHLTAEQLADLARIIRERLLAMLHGATFELEIPPLLFVSAPGERAIYIGHPDAIFRVGVARLVEAERQRITLCSRPGCGRLFMRRKRGLYCSRRCSQIEQLKRYVNRHSIK